MSEEQGSQSQSLGAQSTNSAEIYGASERWEAMPAVRLLTTTKLSRSIDTTKVNVV